MAIFPIINITEDSICSVHDGIWTWDFAHQPADLKNNKTQPSNDKVTFKEYNQTL